MFSHIWEDRTRLRARVYIEQEVDYFSAAGRPASRATKRLLLLGYFALVKFLAFSLFRQVLPRQTSTKTPPNFYKTSTELLFKPRYNSMKRRPFLRRPVNNRSEKSKVVARNCRQFVGSFQECEKHFEGKLLEVSSPVPAAELPFYESFAPRASLSRQVLPN